MCTSALPRSDLPRVHSAPPDHYFLLSVFGNTRRSSSMPVVTPRALDPKVAFWGQPLPCLVVKTLPRVSPRSKALPMAWNRYDPQSAGYGASPDATFPHLGGARIRNKSTSRKRAQSTSEMLAWYPGTPCSHSSSVSEGWLVWFCWKASPRLWCASALNVVPAPAQNGTLFDKSKS